MVNWNENSTIEEVGITLEGMYELYKLLKRDLKWVEVHPLNFVKLEVYLNTRVQYVSTNPNGNDIVESVRLPCGLEVSPNRGVRVDSVVVSSVEFI